MLSRVGTNPMEQVAGQTRSMDAIDSNTSAAQEGHNRRPTSVAWPNPRLPAKYNWLNRRSYPRQHRMGSGTGRVPSAQVARRARRFLEGIQIPEIKSAVDNRVIETADDDGVGYVASPKQGSPRGGSKQAEYSGRRCQPKNTTGIWTGTRGTSNQCEEVVETPTRLFTSISRILQTPMDSICGSGESTVDSLTPQPSTKRTANHDQPSSPVSAFIGPFFRSRSAATCKRSPARRL